MEHGAFSGYMGRAPENRIKQLFHSRRIGSLAININNTFWDVDHISFKVRVRNITALHFQWRSKKQVAYLGYCFYSSRVFCFFSIEVCQPIKYFRSKRIFRHRDFYVHVTRLSQIRQEEPAALGILISHNIEQLKSTNPAMMKAERCNSATFERLQILYSLDTIRDSQLFPAGALNAFFGTPNSIKLSY